MPETLKEYQHRIASSGGRAFVKKHGKDAMKELSAKAAAKRTADAKARAGDKSKTPIDTDLTIE